LFTSSAPTDHKTFILSPFSSFFHLLVNLLFFSSVTWQPSPSPWGKQMLLRQWTKSVN
jgi:hypothetical protein